AAHPTGRRTAAPAENGAAVFSAGGSNGQHFAPRWPGHITVPIPTTTTTTRFHRGARCIRFILVQNRQGKTRLSKWYVPYEDDEKLKLKAEVHRVVAPRDQKFQSNFVEVYTILDEVFLAGEIEETSKNVVLTRLDHLDKLD
ncbi:MAG: hypothetical protein BJ554DRAFT_3913, partial [Olpidium bornovanus]